MAEINPRTEQPYRSERECWESLATDADRRAAQADSTAGRTAMEDNARGFRQLAREAGQ